MTGHSSSPAEGAHGLMGRRFAKVGDHKHVWVVEAVESGSVNRAPFAILVSEDRRAVEDVDLSHLDDPDAYSPLP